MSFVLNCGYYYNNPCHPYNNYKTYQLHVDMVITSTYSLNQSQDYLTPTWFAF